LGNIKEIKSLRGGDVQVAAQANVQIDPRLAKKTISGWKLLSKKKQIGPFPKKSLFALASSFWRYGGPFLGRIWLPQVGLLCRVVCRPVHSYAPVLSLVVFKPSNLSIF